MNPLAARPLPAWVVFQLLERCNLRCGMCYEWGEGGAYHARPVPVELDRALLLRTIRECLPARPMFEFFGGEPMLYPHLWEAIALIREAGCELAFPTNGTLLEAHAQRLVDTPPTRLWISLDGPPAINDRQRGRGVFRRVMRGLDALVRARRARDALLPALGLTFVVTPLNHRHVAEFFLSAIDLAPFASVSIELQSFATPAQVAAYAQLAADRFGVARTPCAQAYVREPSAFAGIDVAALAAQLAAVREACGERGIAFVSQPGVTSAENLGHYLAGRWDRMVDRRSRCAMPWVQAEVSARGEVSTCHTFHDLPIGNLHDASLAQIWQGATAQRLRAQLREGLLPICTACCRYYTGASPLPVPAARAA